LLISVATGLTATGDAYAHRLDAEATVRAVRKVQIEGWFSDDSRPKGATVQVYRVTDGRLLTEGRTDSQGAFVFFADAEPLRVVVDAGEGHRKELTIAAAEPEQDLTRPMPVPERKTEVPIKEVLLGIGLLLAAAAFALSLRNARQLRELGRRSGTVSSGAVDEPRPSRGKETFPAP
jgi:hypothetical protein